MSIDSKKCHDNPYYTGPKWVNVGSACNFMFNRSAFVFAEKQPNKKNDYKNVWRFELCDLAAPYTIKEVINTPCHSDTEVVELSAAMLAHHTGEMPINDEHYEIDGLDPVLELRDAALKSISEDVYRIYMNEQ